MKHRHQKYILPVIIFSQFSGTSLWFAGNAIIKDLKTAYHLQDSAMSTLTSAVQIGFIIGTLIAAIFTISDRYSPRKIFFISALLGGLANLFTLLPL